MLAVIVFDYFIEINGGFNRKVIILISMSVRHHEVTIICRPDKPIIEIGSMARPVVRATYHHSCSTLRWQEMASRRWPRARGHIFFAGDALKASSAQCIALH